MIALEIIMVIIGLGAVIISFRLSDENNEVTGQEQNLDSEEIDKMIKDAVKKTEEEILNKAEEKFSQISNDKIMGFSEYSNDVFDKIEKNHEETVFLYNMLTEKEKEIQKLVHSVDTTNADLRDEAAKTYQKVKKQLSDVDSVLKQIEVESVKDTSNNTEADEMSQENEADVFAFDEKENINSDSDVAKEIRNNTLLDEEEAKAIAEITDSGKTYITQDEYESEENNVGKNENNTTNSNSDIIALYKKGRSILEISKMLSIGQGEVKLVIDLYNAR